MNKLIHHGIIRKLKIIVDDVVVISCWLSNLIDKEMFIRLREEGKFVN